MLRIRHDDIIIMTNLLKINRKYIRMALITQPTFTCLKSTIKTPERFVKFVQS